MDGRPEKRQQWRRRRGAGLCGLAVAALAALACQAAAPASAMTEHCMLDGDDVKSSVFVAPTTETAPVRIVMKGVVYAIPRNYFSYPQAECRTGETRGVLLRMTLPDMQPATEANWDSLYGATAARDDQYVVLSTDQNIISDMAELLAVKSQWLLEGRSAAPVEGLTSFLAGPLDPDGIHGWDRYYAPDRSKPDVIVQCDAPRIGTDPICDLFFKHHDVVWQAGVHNKFLQDWRRLIETVKSKINSFAAPSNR